ncbi:DUF1289 domain-containing protein [Agarivorans sp.]|uniref:DUF1289 domain-containing protein n=1 Tax=Agarivorans sp. TaxID=1872412 RepID=UPI003D033D49
MDLQQQLESPCIRQCTLDGDDICVGCFRHIDEICGWSSMDVAAKRKVLQHCEQRRKLAPVWKFATLTHKN